VLLKHSYKLSYFSLKKLSIAFVFAIHFSNEIGKTRLRNGKHTCKICDAVHVSTEFF